jgi:hypothetical protein
MPTLAIAYFLGTELDARVTVASSANNMQGKEGTRVGL